MVNVLVLAIASAVSPAILAVVIVVLHRPRPQRLLAAYLFGGMLTSIAVGIAIVSSLNGLHVLSGSSPTADPIVNFTVGALALIAAYVLLTDRDARLEQLRRERRESRPARDPWSERVLNRGTAPIAFAVGVAQQKVEALNGWMASHARQIVIAVATTAGLYLVARGVAGIL